MSYLLRGGLRGLGFAVINSAGVTISLANLRTGDVNIGADLHTYQIGDPWQLTITTEFSGADIKRIVTDQAGNTISSAIIGQTDASGVFTQRGTFTDAGAFNWDFFVGHSEGGQWYANSSVMQLYVTVQAAGSGVAPNPAYSGTPYAVPNANVTLAPAGTPATSSLPTAPASSGFDLSSIPWWGWAAAAGVAYFSFGTKGRR